MALRKDKREAIIEAAVAEFRDTGFESAKMDDIAARAGVSKRTVYNHFPSKESLFHEISGQLTDRLVGGTELPFNSRKSLQKQLEELAHRYVEVVSDENFMGLARVVLREKVGQPELSKEKFERIRRGQTGLGEWMREAARQNALELANPAEDARRFSAMLSEFAFWPQLFSGQPPMNGEEKERVIAETVRLFLRGKGCRDGEGEAEER